MMSKMFRKAAVLAAAVAFVGVAGNSARAEDNLFDWTVTADPVPVPGYNPAPFLTDSTGASVKAFITAQNAIVGRKLGVKVQNPLLQGTVDTVYQTAPRPTFTFAEFEGPTGTANATTLRNQINTASGGAVGANTIYVGNFNVYPVVTDPTRPTNVVSTASSYQNVYSSQDYFAAGLNMANEGLYPGAPDFRTSSTKNGHVDDGLGPNIRSELFTLPIIRASLVTANLPAGHRHIPYVNRFNNHGNSAFDTDGNPNNGFRWSDANGQMLSRGDFKAMVAHYRARGIHGYHLLDGGVEGYTRVDFEQDAKEGWEQPQLLALHNAPGSRLATLDTVARVDGNLKNIEESGVVFSGVYNLAQGKLALLVSNMDEIQHSLSFTNKIGGKNIPGGFDVAGGTHRLLEFTSAGTAWQLTNNTVVFADADRNGVGVPEPMTLGMASVFAIGMLSRRRSRK